MPDSAANPLDARMPFDPDASDRQKLETLRAEIEQELDNFDALFRNVIDNLQDMLKAAHRMRGHSAAARILEEAHAIAAEEAAR